MSHCNVGKVYEHGSHHLQQFRFIPSKNGTRLRDKGGLSYITVHEAVLEKLEAIGLDKRQYGLHSLRAGGASAAANTGVPDRMFKRRGRWRSENAKDGYIKDSPAGSGSQKQLGC